MTRLLPLALLGLAAAAQAQAPCFEQNFGVLAPNSNGQAGYGDDVLFDLQPMNINFPMGGLASNYTHAQVCENGVVYLTTGAPSNGSTYAYQTTQFFVGDVGEDPRIAPLWIDLESAPQFGGGVYINNTIPGKFVVTWSNIVEWAAQGPAFTMQAQLFDTGDVIFYYSSDVYGISSGFGPQFVSRAGLTEANGVADPGSSDLSVNGAQNLSAFCLYEEFPLNVFDLQDTALTFTYAGTGYVSTVQPCQPAYHASYGEGCYDISDSVYQYLPDASTAPATLDNQSMVCIPAGGQYTITWGGGSYIPPTGSTPLALTDDGEVNQPLSTPFPGPNGPVNDLWIGANAVVSLAQNAVANSYIPDEQDFLNATATAWYSHHDYNPTEPGSGPVSFLETMLPTGEMVALITWEAVESYPNPGANPSTLQFQFNLTTGFVTIVWEQIDGDPSSPFGSAHLIGYSPAGPSSDGGSVDLATALPLAPPATSIFALELSASPAPVATGTSGTLVTYTTDNLQEYGGGIYIGLHILSFSQANPGLPLGLLLNAPGCNAYVQSIDFAQTMVGPSSTQSVNLFIPANIAPGTQVYAQSICLVVPNSLPNGQNPFGIITSNGIETFVSSF